MKDRTLQSLLDEAESHIATANAALEEYTMNLPPESACGLQIKVVEIELNAAAHTLMEAQVSLLNTVKLQLLEVDYDC